MSVNERAAVYNRPLVSTFNRTALVVDERDADNDESGLLQVEL